MKNRISHTCEAKAETIAKKMKEEWKVHTWSAGLLFWADDSALRMFDENPSAIFKVRVFMPSSNKKIYINIQERVHDV
jgi:hypothetical protein